MKKTMHKLLCIFLSVLVLASLAVVPTSAEARDLSQTIEVTTGTVIDWRSYFTVPNGYRTMKPSVASDNHCANMVGEYRIRCSAPGVATFSIGIRELSGSIGYLYTINIYIIDPAGYLAVFRTKNGAFANGKASIAKVSDSSSIAMSQCPPISGSSCFLTGWTDGVSIWGNNQFIPLKKGVVTFLDACWTPYTISLQPNMGACDQRTLQVENGKEIGEMPTPVRSGYYFDGWYTTAYSSTRWTADTIFRAAGTSEVYLYAHWNPITSNIKTVSVSGVSLPKLNANITTAGIKVSEGMTVNEIYWEKKNPFTDLYESTIDSQFLDGDEYCLHIEMTPKSGFTFAEPIKGLVNGYAAEIERPDPEDNVYVLRYSFPALPKSITVTFDPAGGILGTDSKSMKSSETYGELPTPIRPGYVFLGWFFDTADGSKRVTENGIIAVPDDHTLVAHWEIDDTIGKIAEVDAMDMAMYYKQTRDLLVNVQKTDNTTIMLTYDVYGPDILTVSESGSVYAHAVGTTEILVTATDENGVSVSDVCTVVVQYSFWQQLIRIFLLGFLWY